MGGIANNPALPPTDLSMGTARHTSFWATPPRAHATIFPVPSFSHVSSQGQCSLLPLNGTLIALSARIGCDVTRVLKSQTRARVADGVRFAIEAAQFNSRAEKALLLQEALDEAPRAMPNSYTEAAVQWHSQHRIITVAPWEADDPVVSATFTRELFGL